MKSNTRYRLRETIIRALHDDNGGQMTLAAHYLDKMTKEQREKVLQTIGANVCEHVRTEVKALGEMVENGEIAA